MYIVYLKIGVVSYIFLFEQIFFHDSKQMTTRAKIANGPTTSIRPIQPQSEIDMMPVVYNDRKVKQSERQFMPSRDNDIMEAPPPQIVVHKKTNFQLNETLVYRVCMIVLLFLSVIAIAIAAAGVWRLKDKL